MARHPLIEQMNPFVGKPMLASIDEITAIATSHHCTVNVIDPQFNTGSIDEDPHRLNVRINRDGEIWLFTIG